MLTVWLIGFFVTLLVQISFWWPVCRELQIGEMAIAAVAIGFWSVAWPFAWVLALVGWLVPQR